MTVKVTDDFTWSVKLNITFVIVSLQQAVREMIDSTADHEQYMNQ